MKLGSNLPELPECMQHMDRDKRGLPIPYIVHRERDGTPNFTINDMRRTVECLSKGLCAITGQPMNDDVWFIGGPQAAYHPMGAFLDPPGKYEALRFAAQVCPFIAHRPFQGFKSGPQEDVIEGDRAILVNQEMDTGKPPFFVLAKCDGFIASQSRGHVYLHPSRPWLVAEHWQDGEKIGDFTRKQIKDTLAEWKARHKDELDIPVIKRRLDRGELAGNFPWTMS